MGKCYRAFSGKPIFAAWVSTYKMALVVVLTFCPKCQKQGWASQPRFRVLSLGLPADPIPAQGSNLRLISCIVGRFFTTSATWEALSESRSVVSNTAAPHSPLNSPGQDTAVGSLSLFQQIFPTQESNQGFLHCRRILYQLSRELPLRPDL